MDAKDPIIAQPHDSLLRHLMSSHDNAVSFLQSRVPSEVAAAGDWPRLRLISSALFGNALERFECDLLYVLPIGDPNAGGQTELLIYILFEHQSRREPMMPLRLLEYMIGIWRRWLEDHSAAEGLPVILPLVLSQVEGGWNISPRFEISSIARNRCGQSLPSICRISLTWSLTWRKRGRTTFPETSGCARLWR